MGRRTLNGVGNSLRCVQSSLEMRLPAVNIQPALISISYFWSTYINMSHTLRYSHIFFSRDGGVTPLIPTSYLPSHLVTILPPDDTVIALQELLPRDPNIHSITPETSQAGDSPDQQPPCPTPPPEKKKNKAKEPESVVEENEPVVEDREPPKLCTYFNQREGCKRGVQCRFLHESSSEERRRRMVQGELWRRSDEKTNVPTVGSFALPTLPGQVTNIPQKSESSAASAISCATPGRIVSSTDGPVRLIRPEFIYLFSVPCRLQPLIISMSRNQNCASNSSCFFSHSRLLAYGPLWI